VQWYCNDVCAQTCAKLCKIVEEYADVFLFCTFCMLCRLCVSFLCPVVEVYLVIVWRGQATVPTGSPLPLAAPARGERLLRQRVLEVLAAEVSERL
jgi:hypothetical protein